ncbi:hypothetical protein G3I48_20495 [Streptomyces griseus]|uniref:hypothetical protein n=1 Tax=Streptomyces griseus TaxID=1911 RepID=UPI0013BD6DF2|nr:hypothetical protein [Streptomyces griseus]
MSDAKVRIPEEAQDRLAAIAAEGLLLRAYLTRRHRVGHLEPVHRRGLLTVLGCICPGAHD